jgi:hypothetical protein
MTAELDLPETYVRLGWLIEQHLPGYVDGYYGPAELRAAVEAEGKLSLDVLEALAESLEQAVAADTSLLVDRRQFLSSEVGAMRTTLRILAGETLDIVDEVRSLYGAKAEWIDERLFADAHSVLEEILPGAGPLSARVVAFRERSTVPAEVATPILRDLMAELRERTVARFALPQGEECEIIAVRDQPWAAYNWYLGGAKSRIEVNQDLPKRMYDLPDLIAHESYPGHHTEHSIKEERLYRQERRLEHSILLSNTPSALVSEGLACCALETAMSEDEIAGLYVRCYEAAGLSADDAALAKDFTHAMRPLGKVSDNQVLMLYRDRASDEEIIAYGLRHALTDEQRERHHLRFYKEPLWRSYMYNYTIGYDLVSAFLQASPNKSAAFARLLHEPLPPEQLQRSIATQG